MPVSAETKVKILILFQTPGQPAEAKPDVVVEAAAAADAKEGIGGAGAEAEVAEAAATGKDGGVSAPVLGGMAGGNQVMVALAHILGAGCVPVVDASAIHADVATLAGGED